MVSFRKRLLLIKNRIERSYVAMVCPLHTLAPSAKGTIYTHMFMCVYYTFILLIMYLSIL
jgi:hypothetical protein